MHVEQKRIFIGNLPPNIQEDDITEQFARYGNIVSVEIKRRKDIDTANTSSVFAFVSVHINNKKLNQCFQELPRQKWQGYTIKLELAKESFLERLKREREEVQNQSTKTIISTKTETPSTTYIPPVFTTANKIYESSTSSESDSFEFNGESKNIKVCSNSTITSEYKNSEASENDGVSLVIKNNKTKLSNKVNIESVNKPLHIVTGSKKNELKDKKSIEADEKRRKSLLQMKNSYQNQKTAIKRALSSIDSKPKNKIIFDDDLNSDNKQEHNLNNHQVPNENLRKRKLALFEDDVQDDDNVNFEIKKQFEGTSGQKLLELQSRFTNDKRFTLDSRFLADEEEKDHNILEDDEKQEQINILESVLGHKIRTSSKIDVTKNTNIPQGMIRFDPTNPEHSKFEIKEQPKKKERKKNKKLVEEMSKVEKNIEVSKETFYKVTDNLKKSLQEKENFSLLSLFGKIEDKDENESVHEEIKEIKKHKEFDQNPFKYDSSDTEDEDVKKTNKKIQNIRTEHAQNTRRSSWPEKFFFRENDERLEEGLSFLKKVCEVKSTPFEETRNALRKVIRAKVRNRLRNNRPFQKKLGRHKMIKVKKAMKN